MKKFVAVLFAALFVLGLSATAFADVNLSGDLRTRGELTQNTSDFDSDAADYRAWYEQRAILAADIKIGDNVGGKIALESVYNFGTVGTAGGGYGETGGNEATGGYPYGNEKRADFKLLEGWVLYKFGGMYGIKVGHMPLALGNKVFFDHTKSGDDAIVFFADPNPNLHIGLLTAKFAENTNPGQDDQDAVVALFTYKSDAFNFSGDLTVVSDNKADFDMYNIGLRGDTKMGGIKLYADVEIQTGEFDDSGAKFKGMAFVGGLAYSAGNISFGLEGGYGSGDDDAADDEIGTFITSLSPSAYTTYLYGYRGVKTACGAGQYGICNLTYGKLSVGTKPSDQLSVSAAAIWLQASEEVAGQDEIGVEVDWNVTYKFTKNLSYVFEGGYLFAGDFYGSDVDDPYAMRHVLQLTF